MIVARPAAAPHSAGRAEHEEQAPPVAAADPTPVTTATLGSPDAVLRLKQGGKSPILALYRSLDARRIIKRRLKRRQAQHALAVQQDAQLEAMAAQLVALEAEQAVLAARIEQEQAACRLVSAHLAALNSALERRRVRLDVVSQRQPANMPPPNIRPSSPAAPLAT